MRLTRWHILLGIAGVCALGFVYLILTRRTIRQQTRNAESFLAQLQAFIRSHGQDTDAYSWLLRRSHGLQVEMGALGVLGFKAPHANYIVHNWPVVVNSLTEMRLWSDQGYRASGAPRQQFYDYGATLQEAILRFAGTLEDRIGELTRSLRNPLIWFRNGITLILLAPFMVLRSLGVSGIPEATALSGKSVFKMLAAVATLATIAASAVTIIDGWDKTLLFTKTVVAHFHR
jgi:hypothetical protein